MKTWGTPDGRSQKTQVAIGLPSLFMNQDNHTLILVVYLVGTVILVRQGGRCLAHCRVCVCLCVRVCALKISQVCAVVLGWLLRGTRFPHVTRVAPTRVPLSCAADPAGCRLRVCAVPTIRRPDGDDGKSSSTELAKLSSANATCFVVLQNTKSIFNVAANLRGFSSQHKREHPRVPPAGGAGLRARICGPEIFDKRRGVPMLLTRYLPSASNL